MDPEKIKKILLEKFPEKIKEKEVCDFSPAFEVDKDIILEVCRFLKESQELSYNLLSCMVGVDRGDGFEVIYCLFSFSQKHKFTLKVPLPKDNPEIESVTPIWNAANWHEREIAELFGIKFLNHPDPRGILLPEDWDEGYPMRKDWEGKDFVRLPEKK
jgi:NADH-quinone oxidoreductase subunit C